MIFFVILTYIVFKTGVEFVGSMGGGLIWVVMVKLIIISIVAIPLMNISSLKPILNNGRTPILNDGL